MKTACAGPLALILLLGGYLVIHGHLGVGAILAFSARSCACVCAWRFGVGLAARRVAAAAARQARSTMRRD